MPHVSLVMIVRDEAAALPKCLGSVADLVGEIVVVDTGSVDRTRAVASQFGARVIDFTWIDDFSAARNESLKHATGDWIFWLDADEWLALRDRENLQHLFANLPDELVGYSMRQVSPTRFIWNGTPAAFGEQNVGQLRLFRNDPRIRWEGRVFEQVRPSLRRAGGEVRVADVKIQHGGYEDGAAMLRRIERNLRLIRLQLADTPDDPYTQAHLGDLLCATGRPDEAIPVLRGCRDRLPAGSASQQNVSNILQRLGVVG